MVALAEHGGLEELRCSVDLRLVFAGVDFRAVEK